MTNVSRRSFVAGAGAAAAAALAGCSNGNKAGSGSLKKITFVLDWTPNTNHTGVYVAQNKGYYEEAGLQVEIVQGPDNGADSLVATGEAQFGVSFQDVTMTNYVSSKENKLPVTAVAAIIQHNTSGIISRKDKNITRPAEMAGHSYATWDLPVEQALIKKIVTDDGGNYDEVQMIPSTVSDEVTALQTDQVDTIWIYSAWAGVKCSITEGLETNYFDFRSIDDTFDCYTPVIIANNDLIEKEPETVQAFIDATRKGYEFAIENPHDAGDILLEASPELDKDLVYASQDFLADKYQADAEKWGKLDQARWDAFFSWVNTLGIVDTIEPGAGMTDKFCA